MTAPSHALLNQGILFGHLGSRSSTHPKSLPRGSAIFKMERKPEKDL